MQNREDKINILLILFSLIAALLLPFSLFLFSYAILGPLHYLTEINWLNNKSYFVQKKAWVVIYLILTFAVALPPLLHLPFFNLYHSKNSWLQTIANWLDARSDVFLLTMLFFSAALLYFKQHYKIVIALVVSFVISKLIIQYLIGSYFLMGIFLPTIIHVYFFTLCFMLLGAINTKSAVGISGVVLLAVAPFIIYFVGFNQMYFNIESSLAIQTVRNFRFVNYIARLFDAGSDQGVIASHHMGLKIQTFIAFCYTYHYANWFSKISVIKWHKNISVVRIVFILIMWLFFIALFLYNYEIAYLAIYFLTILHIVLEFPLNIKTISELISKLKLKQSTI